MDLIKNRIRESLQFSLIETLLDEDYPTSFNMEEFKTLKSFNKRINYCEEHLKRISSGSSRIVYMIDDTKVLKLAKNQKGLAQVETEAQWGQDSYFDDILAHTFDVDHDNYWVEMELARKLNKNQFKQITGCDIEELSTYLTNAYSINNPSKKIHRWSQSPEMKEYLDENHFASLVLDFMLNVDALPGDLGKLDSYGLVKRDGQDDVVLIDFGITNDIYDNYYR